MSGAAAFRSCERCLHHQTVSIVEEERGFAVPRPRMVEHGDVTCSEQRSRT